MSVLLHHLTFEVEPRRRQDEELFWRALGFASHVGSRSTMPKTKWMSSGEVGAARFFVWLRYSDAPALGSIALVPEADSVRRLSGVEAVLARLNRLPFAVRAEEALPYWSARRTFVYSPTGHRIELLDAAPNASRYGPPEE